MIDLSSIVVLWLEPHCFRLWGIPYPMRPTQSPTDLWKAGNTKGWVELSDSEWSGYSAEQKAAIKAFKETHKDMLPGHPFEWSVLK